MSLERLDIKGIRVDKANFTETQAGKNLNEVVSINFKKINQKIDAADLKKDDITALLEKYGQDSSKKNRKNISSFEFDNNKNTLTINYKDSNLKKIINEDLSYQTIQKNTNKSGEEEVISFYNADNTLSKENIITDNSSVEILFDKNKKKYQTTEFDKNKNTTTVIKFDESENPEFKSVTCGTTVSTFDYKGENNSERILERTENKGLPIESKETYTYRDDGYVEIRHFSSSAQSDNVKNDKSASELKSSSSDTKSFESNATSESVQNNKNETVVYCSSSNFDSKTGTVKNKDEVTSKPPTESENSTVKSDESNNNQTESKSEKENISINSEVKTPSEVKNETKAVQNSGETKQHDSNVKSSSEHNKVKTDVKTGEIKSHTTIEVKVENKVNVKSAQSDVTTDSGNKAGKGNATFVSTYHTVQSNVTKDGGNQAVKGNTAFDNSYHAIQHNVKSSSKYSESDTAVILQEKLVNLTKQSKTVREALNNFIMQYASNNNLSIDKVNKLLGINNAKFTHELMVNISNITKNSNNIEQVTKLLTEFKNLLSNTNNNISEIKIKIQELANFTSQSTSENNKQNDSNYMSAAAKPITDINKFSIETGFKASQLNEIIASLDFNETTSLALKTANTANQEERIFKFKKTSDRVILAEELKTQSSLDTEKVTKVKNELSKFLPPAIRKELDKCSSVSDCKKVIEKYAKTNNYTFNESVKPNVKSTDIQYQYIYKDGVFKKIPADRQTNMNFSSVEEIRLDVTADKQLLDELVDVMSKGTYKGKSGQIVKIKKQNMLLKTATTLQSWTSQNEPVVLSFDKPVTKELEQAIREIAHKYIRKKTGNIDVQNENDKTLIARSEIINNEVKDEKIAQILNGLGFSNAQIIAFIASMAYVSSDGIRKNSVNKNSNETELSHSQTVNMKDSVD